MNLTKNFTLQELTASDWAARHDVRRGHAGREAATGGRAMKWMLVLLLAGCGNALQAPQRVEVPVFTPCLKTVPQRPAYEFDQLAPAATDGEIILALARDWQRGRKYEQLIEAALSGAYLKKPISMVRYRLFTSMD